MREKRVQSGGRNGGRQSVVVSPEGIGQKGEEHGKKTARLQTVLYTTHNWAAVTSASLSVFLLTQHFWQGSSAWKQINRRITSARVRLHQCANVEADLNTKLDVATHAPHTPHTPATPQALALYGVMAETVSLAKIERTPTLKNMTHTRSDAQRRLVRCNVPPCPKRRMSCTVRSGTSSALCGGKKKKNLHVLTELHFVGSNFLHGSCFSSQISKCTAAMS